MGKWVSTFGASTFGEEDNFVARGITDNARLDFWDYPVYLTLNNVEVNQNYAVGNFIDSNANSNSGNIVGLSTIITINGNNSVTLHSGPISYGNNNAPANCINCVGGLALIGNGTLTITTADPDNCGIIAANYPADGELQRVQMHTHSSLIIKDSVIGISTLSPAAPASTMATARTRGLTP